MMKMSKIALAVATAGVVVSSHASTISGGALAGLGTNEADGTGSGVSAIAMIVQGDVHNALQTMQSMGNCIGSRTKLCAPSLSSSEVRGLLNNSQGSASSGIVGPGGTLLSNYGDATNYTGTVATKGAINHGRSTSGNVDDALTAFVQSGVIAGLACGQGAGLEGGNSGASGATDADVISAVSGGATKARMGFIHATELDDSNQDYGFVKIDGVAPDLVNLLSSNYNLVSNIHGALTPSSTEKATHGMTVGAAAAGGTTGVAYHNVLGAFIACAPTDSGAVVIDANGGGL